jgi:hypothetical protein
MASLAVELTPAERRARAVALGAVARARTECFDAAAEWFREAIRLDPLLDLADTPDFWRLPMPGLQAAVRAYELAGREHQAAVLSALIRRTFRPRLVR